MADRYVITVIAMVGIALIIAAATPYILSQNQLYIKNLVEGLFAKFDERAKITDHRAAQQSAVNKELAEKLDKGYKQIIAFQNISNKSGQTIVKQLFNVEGNIQTNLTRHREVTNYSVDNIERKQDVIISKLDMLLNRTS